MEGFLQPLLTFVLLYKYAAIFLITMIGALAVPVPAGSVVIASAFFSTEGYLDLTGVFLAALLGNVAGDIVAFWLVRRFGEPILQRLGWRRFIQTSRIAWLERWVASHPFLSVFASRFVAVLSPVVNILAGLARMPWRVYASMDVAGNALEVAFLCACGFLFGENWSAIRDILSNVGIIIGLVVALILLLLWQKRRQAHKKPSLP